MEASLSPRTYCKIALHSAKYPYGGGVVGFILGRKLDDNTYDVSDVLPVCHGPPAGPVCDIAFTVGEKMHDQQSVIGVYFSNGQRDSDEEPHFVNRLIKGIAANANGFCLVLQLKSSLVSDSTKLWVKGSCKGGAVSLKTIVPPSSLNTTVDSLLASNMQVTALADMEDHMNDSEKDFRNTSIDTALIAGGGR